MKVSVIIPVYNIERYISKCLDSVIGQSLKDIEIICINDGSIDKSIDTLRKYEEKYSNVKVINQKNKGQGFSRNIALKHSKGKYIYFLDGDDYIHKDTLKIAYKEAIENNLDIVTFDSTLFYDEEYIGNYSEVLERSKNLENRVKKGLEFITEAGSGNCFRTESWLNFYKKEFLDNNNIKFSEQRIYEDIIQVFDSYIMAKRVKFIPKVLLYRRIRNDSAVTSPTTIINVEGYYIAAKELYKRYIDIKLFINESERDILLRYIRLYIMRSIQRSDILRLETYRKEIATFIHDKPEILDIKLDIQINSPNLFYSEFKVSL